MRNLLLLGLGLHILCGPSLSSAASNTPYDILIRGGEIYDGSGGKSFLGDVAVKGDRIVYAGPKAKGKALKTIDAKGKAVSPGFINMLAHPEESLLVDGRALSDLKQGVTLEVLGEDSMGPLTEEMKRLGVQRQIDIHYPITWTTLGDYLAELEKRGISLNVASYVGAATVRTNILGEKDVMPSAEQLTQMQALVHHAMEEGAVGVTTALIYAPATYAKTPELIALARESARCGGIYSAHIRNEGDHIEEALQETIDIAEASGGPAEIFHLKFAGKENWHKIGPTVETINAARARGIRITADMYNYIAGATGLDASMPRWVQEGGIEAWVARMKDPATRAKVLAEIRAPKSDWENLYRNTGAQGMLFLQFKNEKLKPLTGKTLAQVAEMRGTTPEDTMIDLVIEDGSRVGVAYFQMTEENVRKQIALPWVSFDSDEAAYAPEGVFLKSNPHPRAYGNFARLLGKYVRDEKVTPLEQAIYKLSGLPADVLSLKDRGRVKAGYIADIVVFDPATIQDHATYDKPHQYATGVTHVLVNGGLALENGEATAARPGRAVRSRSWTGYPDGGCRNAAKDWTWSK